jgi:hypothetical protein
MHLQQGDDEQAIRFSRLASELGLDTQQIGVESAIAIRRGQWQEAKRLIAAQTHLPDVIKPFIPRFVDALADPKLRPQVVTEMRAIDPAAMEQMDLIQPYVQLGAVDVAYGLLFDALDKDPKAWTKGWDTTFAWGADGAAFRRNPRFAELAERMGLVDYWKQYGYPDGCRAGEDQPVVCS